MKINKLLSCLIAAALIVNASPVFSAAKRDVNDPVLREIINELSKKMPKFIDKYGETVFVEDEPITRGALISAIYEYDRRAGGGAAAVPETSSKVSITRQEFDSLRNKVASLEKTSSSRTASGGNADVVTLIANLEPNMPMLLDNSLKNSKVFKELQQQVLAGGGAKGGTVLSATVTKDITNLNTRLDTLAKKIDSTALKVDSISTANAGGTKGSVSYAAVSKDIDEINEKIEVLSKRIDTAQAGSTSGSKVAASGVTKKEMEDLRKTLIQIQTSYVALSKRVDEVDSRPVVASGGSSSGADVSHINKQLSDIRKTVAGVPSTSDIKREIDRSKNQTQSDIERIERRLNSLSRNYASSESSSQSSSSGEKGSGGAATIATISLGITMIAALFVAR